MRLILRLKYPSESRGNVFPLVLVIVLVVLLFKGNFANAQQVSGVSPAGTKYLIYTPPGYSTSTTTYPLLLFLHGGAEIGDDLTKLTSGTAHQIPSRLIYLNQWPSNRPFIVLTPQLKRDPSIPNYNDQEWPTAYVDEVVESVRKKYRIDAYKIYVTGISLGGAGVWTYAAAYPNKVAAILPISGKSDVTKACVVKNIPIWAFHGENDALVRPKFSIDMINAMKACQPVGIYKPRLTLLYSRGHEGWSEIYNGSIGYRVFDWFLKFRRTTTTNKTPYVHAGNDLKILLRTTSFHLYGDYFDFDGTVSTVLWRQTSGVALTLSGTNTPFLKLTNLKAGTFEFELAVTDNLGAKAYDRVVLTISSSATTPGVTGMVLMNGKTNADVTTLSEGKVINKTTLGLTEVNIRAIASTGTGSVKFSVNSDLNTRLINQPGPYLIKKQTSAAEWTIANGNYVVCATPYSLNAGKGTQGLTLCYRITVTSSTTATASAYAPEEILIHQEDDLLVTEQEEGNYQWVHNGVDIDQATQATYKPLDPGAYYVRFWNDSIEKISNVIDFKKEIHGVEIFPNPASRFLLVKGLDAERAPYTYRIINTTGMEIQKGTLRNDEISFENFLPKGVYTLQLHDLNGKERSFKFIIE